MELEITRLIFTIFVFLTYIFFCFKTKRPFYITTLFLLVIFPFNITLQLTNFDVYIQGISSNYLIPTLSILDVFVFLLILFAFKNQKLKKNTKLFFTILFLFFTTKAFLDNNLLSTLLIYRIFFYTLSLVYVFESFSFKKNTKTISKILFACVTLQTVVGILQFQKGHSLGLHFLGESTLVKGMFGSSFVDLNNTLFLRAYGTFPHPNILAGVLLFVLFFTISNIKKEKINIATSILATILIFFTFSRIVILLTLFLWVGFFLFHFLKTKSIQKNTKHFSLLPLFFTRFSNLFLENDSSFADRWELVKTAKEILKNHPYFGIGVGRFVHGIDYFPVYTAGGFLLLQPVHNVPLLILSEYGFVFGIPLIFLTTIILLRGFFRGNLLIKYFVFSTLAILTFDHYFITTPQGNILFAGILIFCVILQSNCKIAQSEL